MSEEIKRNHSTNSLLVRLHNNRVLAALAETGSKADEYNATADGILMALMSRRLTKAQVLLVDKADSGLLDEVDLEGLE